MSGTDIVYRAGKQYKQSLSCYAVAMRCPALLLPDGIDDIVIGAWLSRPGTPPLSAYAMATRCPILT
eukprot:3940321-Rhodomonas_salina.10